MRCCDMATENKLCVLACENFKREVEAVIESEKFDDVAIVTFPADCSPSPGQHQALTNLIGSCREKYGRVFMVAGCYFPNPDRALLNDAESALQGMSRCFDYFSSKASNDWYVGRGSYLLTPGWLLKWPHYMERWGLDRQTARDFFGETSKRLVLLDTGVFGDVHATLQEFAEHVGLSYEIIPVGLEHFRALLTNAVLKSRLETAERGAASGEMRQSVSDYAMAFDLLGSLAGATTEAQAVENMLDLFARMFAPGKLKYYLLAKGTAKASPGSVAFDNPDDCLEALENDFAWAKSGNGFVLRVGEKDIALGILEVDDLAFPQYKEQYLALALVLVRVCAMSILNGRSYGELAQVNEQLTHRSAELEAANNELEAFCYSVSHDLRAPLRNSEGFSAMLLEDYGDRLDQQGKEYLLGIRKFSQLMGDLIDDLLGLSRVTRHEMHWDRVDLSGVAGSIIDDLKKGFPDRMVKVTITPGLFCRGDDHLLRIVLDNLLRNAWKFTGKTASAAIEMGVIDHEGVPAYFVRDNGAGFDMAYADKLFKPFQRLHSNEDFEGTGVGLATVYRIIQRHGGKVWAEGKVGGGATFYFTLETKGSPKAAEQN